MKDNFPFPDESIIKTLEVQGHSWKDLFLLGTGSSASICRFESGHGMFAFLIEDDSLNSACKKWLEKQDALRFESIEDVKKYYEWDGIFRP